MSGASMLVTGATGVVGHELMTVARDRGWEVTGCSARGADGVVAWRMGTDPAPPQLRRDWDVVVHTAARPRWNLPAEQAHEANVQPLLALRDVLSPQTHLVHLSTAFAIGLRGDVASADLGDYRNSYEWSKAEAERVVREHYDRVSIVRPPLIVGRRQDGHVARFSGLYSVLQATVSGLLPAFVGEPTGLQEIVSTCDVATCVLAVADAGPDQAPPVHVLGRGRGALTLKETTEAMYLGLNSWRTANGHPPLPLPPLVTTDQWYRFYLPFSRPHLTSRQLRTIDLLDEFVPYMSVSEPMAVTWEVEPMSECIEIAARRWAERLPQRASGAPKEWAGEESAS